MVREVVVMLVMLVVVVVVQARRRELLLTGNTASSLWHIQYNNLLTLCGYLPFLFT